MVFNMKKVGVFLIAAALIAGVVGCDAPSTGVQISNWHDLDAVRDDPDGTFILMNDLNSTTAGYTELANPTANEGKGWLPIGIWPNTFVGSFDGQKYQIKNLFINRPTEEVVGLFAFVDEGGVIENIGMVNVDVTGQLWVGGLVGLNKGTVSNSYSTGSVSGGYQDVGGLVGTNIGTVSNSYSSSNVTGSEHFVGGLVGTNQGTVTSSYSTGNVTGKENVGGLVGSNTGFYPETHPATHMATVSNSYSTGSVSGLKYVGGLVGENSDTVTSSYSIGRVVGNFPVGGLVGWNTGTTSNSFWDIETSGQNISAGGTGKTTAELQDINTFSGATWNIVAVANPDIRNLVYIWNIVDDETYSFLSWETVS